MQKIVRYLLLVTCFCCFSQRESKILYGTVIGNNDVVVNAHVYNLSTKQGTFTNKGGAFKILAKENDSIQISSVGYLTKIFIPKAFNFGMDKNHILLEKMNITLEEVMLKKHNLTGNLATDLKKTPKDTIADLVKSMVDGIHKLDYSAIANMDVGFDEIHLRKVTINTVPNSFKGATFLSTGIGGNSIKKIKLQANKLEEKRKLPLKILIEFGEDFFFKKLKIPKENYYHFIDYCSYKNILKLYKNKELLKLIRIFQKESIAYLNIIKLKE